MSLVEKLTDTKIFNHTYMVEDDLLLRTGLIKPEEQKGYHCGGRGPIAFRTRQGGPLVFRSDIIILALQELEESTRVSRENFIMYSDFYDPVIAANVLSIQGLAPEEREGYKAIEAIAFTMLYRDKHSENSNYPNIGIYVAYSMLIPNYEDQVPLIQTVREDPAIVVQCFQRVFPEFDTSNGKLRLRYNPGDPNNPGEKRNPRNPLRYQDFLTKN